MTTLSDAPAMTAAEAADTRLDELIAAWEAAEPARIAALAKLYEAHHILLNGPGDTSIYLSVLDEAIEALTIVDDDPNL